MLDSPTQTTIMDWLDLYPELLSATNRPHPGNTTPAATPDVPLAGDGAGVAAISAQTVLSWGGAMTFYQPTPMSPPPELGAVSSAYLPPDRGGTQEEALAHLVNHLTGGRGW